MNSATIHNNLQLSFQKTGSGDKILILFHGFGQHKQIFDELTSELESQYTLYSFDLFFHGTSQWNRGEQALEKETWRTAMHQFLGEKKIKKFILLGFSPCLTNLRIRFYCFFYPAIRILYYYL